jgi:hypothetical protein
MKATPKPTTFSISLLSLLLYSVQISLVTRLHRLIWDGLDCEFRDPPSTEDESRVKSLLPEHRPCTNCGFVAEEALRRTLRPIGPELAPNGFTQFGYNYHIGDFIYVRPNISSVHLLLVAQITAIDGLQSVAVKDDDIVCHIRYFKRYSKGPTFQNEVSAVLMLIKLGVTRTF